MPKKKLSDSTEDQESEFLAVMQKPLVLKIGRTTYIVNSKFSPNARLTLLEVIWRLIKNDPGLNT